MLRHPRVVRRALEGQVQGHLHAQLPGARDEGDEVLDAAQLGVDGVVPAVGRADAVGRTGIPGLGHQRIVAALAVGGADGRDGGEVEHVEAHGGDAVQVLRGGAQGAGAHGAVRVAARAQRAGEDLVPGAGQGAGAVDLEGVGGAGRDVVAQGQAVQNGDDIVR